MFNFINKDIYINVYIHLLGNSAMVLIITKYGKSDINGKLMHILYIIQYN